MTEPLDSNIIPSHMRLRLPEHMSPEDYAYLLEVLGKLGITNIRTRTPQPQGRTVIRQSIMVGPAKPESTKNERHQPAPLEVPREVRAPILVDELIEFAKTTEVADNMARGCWNALHNFWKERRFRHTYLQRPISETSKPIRDKASKAQQLALACDTIAHEGENIERIDLISLYETLRVIMHDDKSLIQGLGAKKIAFLTRFVNHKIDTSIYPPLDVPD